MMTQRIRACCIQERLSEGALRRVFTITCRVSHAHTQETSRGYGNGHRSHSHSEVSASDSIGRVVNDGLG